jgi:predicted DNA-binding transcriptional regulator YafY
MSNLHRILWIDRQIRENRYPSSKSISEKYEISTRQVLRDIEYMRYSMGAPIEYSASMLGYFYSNENFAIPSNFISEDERQMISYLGYLYQKSGNEQANKIAELFMRLSEGKNKILNKQISIPIYTVNAREQRTYSILQSAICNLSKVEMRYIDSSDKDSLRIFCPYKIFMSKQKNYIVGFCELQNAIRVFRLDRIVSISSTSVNFQISPLFNAKDYEDGTSFKLKSPYTAVIKFNKILDQYKHNYKLVNQDEFVYEITFYESQEIVSEIMTFNTGFKIISPNWLREKFIEKLQELIKNNI